MLQERCRKLQSTNTDLNKKAEDFSKRMSVSHEFSPLRNRHSSTWVEHNLMCKEHSHISNIILANWMLDRYKKIYTLHLLDFVKNVIDAIIILLG